MYSTEYLLQYYLKLWGKAGVVHGPWINRSMVKTQYIYAMQFWDRWDRCICIDMEKKLLSYIKL